MKAKTREFAAEMKKCVGDSELSESCIQLKSEIIELHDQLNAETDKELQVLMDEFGVTPEQIEMLEKMGKVELEDRYWQEQIQQAPIDCDLESVAAKALETILSTLDSAWLSEQRAEYQRPIYDDSDQSSRKVILAGREKIDSESPQNRPHRFAEMIFSTEDFVSGRNDLDLHRSPQLVTDLATLGLRLNLVKNLGVEALSKLKSLHQIKSQDVPSTVHELLVGTACIAKGLEVEMLVASNTEKTPDFRVHNKIVPIVIECKRRLGVSQYVKREAKHLASLYDAIDEQLERHHAFLDVNFKDEVFEVTPEEFGRAAVDLITSHENDESRSFSWGTLKSGRLPTTVELEHCRIHSPQFYKDVFNFSIHLVEWDGMIAEFDPCNSSMPSIVRFPRCLRWKTENEKALVKKARGITSLWADACKQIPPGEFGCIYVAYTEHMSDVSADARTQHLLNSVDEKSLHHHASIQVPLTVVNRLYPQAKGTGTLEIIENSIPLTLDGYDHMLEEFPIQVFAPTQDFVRRFPFLP